MATKANFIHSLIGAGMKGSSMSFRAATAAGVAQTQSFLPYRLTDPTKAIVHRDEGPNDGAGALTSTSISETGYTFTPENTSEVGITIIGEWTETP